MVGAAEGGKGIAAGVLGFVYMPPRLGITTGVRDTDCGGPEGTKPGGSCPSAGN